MMRSKSLIGRGLVLAALGCSGSGLLELEMDKTIAFEVHSLEEHLTRISCFGRMYMPELRVRASCHYTSSDSDTLGTTDSFEAAIEYLPHPEAVWLHFYVADDEKSHYPVSQGLPMAMHLSPGGKGWVGDSVFYPRDSGFGYMDRPVEAWVE
jgi:hypothetical protein